MAKMMAKSSFHLLFLFCFVMPKLVLSIPEVRDSGLVSHSSLQEIENKQPITEQVKTEKAYKAKLLSLPLHGTCSNKDISISQSRVSTSGIPQYVVQILNTCLSGCAPSNIHLHCSWFASSRMVNPRLFKRLSYDDCLVNGGKALRSSEIIRFAYSNSFMYPLAFKSANFC